MNQRGSTSYLLLASVITVGLLGTALAFTWNRLNACHEARAALQQQVADLEGKLEEQNRAVEDLAKRSHMALEASRKALEAARGRGQALAKEAERIRGAMARKPVSDCQAGEAVKEIRRGLG